MAKPLLSIVVPTKDRYVYLSHLINQFRRIATEEMELVIQDNTTDNSFILQLLTGINDNRIVYNHIAGQLPVPTNADLAVKHSTGEYISFVGDDDGFTKYIIDAVKWMKQNNIDAVKPAEVYYFWPDANTNRGIPQAGCVVCKKLTGKVSLLSPKKELDKLLKDGIPDRGNIPIAYHAIVKRSVMDQILQYGQTYFPGISSDIANAVALSLLVEKYAVIDLPIVYSGSSLHKNGSAQAKGNTEPPKFSDLPWLLPDAEKNWNKRIPKLLVGELIWAESALSALDHMNRADLYSKVNFNRIYARVLINRPKHKDLVLPYAKKGLNFYKEIGVYFLEKYIGALLRRIGWLTHIIEKAKTYSNISNSEQASHLLEKLYRWELH